MAKQILIQIPQPCHEDWNSMTSLEKGRFCNSCQKTVFDFTSMTNDQLANFFATSSKHVCGRFSEDQLNKQIDVPVKKIPWLTYFFKITIPLLLVSLKTTAQQVLHKNNTVMVVPEKKPLEAVMPEKINVIEGIVQTADGVGIPYATVMITGTNHGTSSDSTGYFSLKVKEGNKFIEISSLGYDRKKIEINIIKKSVPINLEKGVLQGYLGGIVVKSYSRKKITKKTKEKTASRVSPIESNSVTIYPNPVSTFSNLTLKWQTPVTEDQVVEVYTIAGELVRKEKINIDKATSSIQIQLTLKNTGNYIVRTTGSKTHKSLTTQILVN